MLLTIGTFIKEGDDFFGGIATLLFQQKAVIVACTSKRGKRAPDYRVYSNGVKIGEGRKSMSEDGRSYVSVTLDDPSFVQTVNCGLLDEGFGQYVLVWKRPRTVPFIL